MWLTPVEGAGAFSEVQAVWGEKNVLLFQLGESSKTAALCTANVNKCAADDEEEEDN